MCSATRSSRPTLSASRTAGTKPACETRFGSSNRARVLAAVCNNRTYEVPFRRWVLEPQQLRFSQVKGHFFSYDTLPATISAVDPGSGRPPVEPRYMGMRRSPSSVRVRHGAARCGHNCGQMGCPTGWSGGLRPEPCAWVRASALSPQLDQRSSYSLPAEAHLAIMSADGSEGPVPGFDS